MVNISVQEASLHEVRDWLSSYLHAAADYSMSVPLRSCKDTCGRDEGVRIFGEDGRERHPNDRLYEDAFLVTLKELVETAKVTPEFAGEAQRKAWTDWVSGMPCVGISRDLILAIPLRSVEWLNAETEKEPAQRAGEHLLNLLKPGGTVRFQRFYDGTDETHLRLHKEFGLGHEDESPAILIDAIVWQLKKARLVETTEMPEWLSDGLHDYQIELTAEGRAFVDGGKVFTFQDVELL